MKKEGIRLADVLFVLVFFTYTLLIAQNSDKELIVQTSLNYIEGAYEGNVERMTKAIHPELQKIIVTKFRGSDREITQYSSYSIMIEGTKAKLFNIPKDQREIEVEVQDIYQNIASVKISSINYIDYCHLMKINGEWKIINVLWKMNSK